MEIAASYLVNYTTWNPSDFWCVLITILFLISFFSFCLNEYPELVGKKTDFDIKTIDAENNPLGKDN